MKDIFAMLNIGSIYVLKCKNNYSESQETDLEKIKAQNLICSHNVGNDKAQARTDRSQNTILMKVKSRMF